MGQTAELVATSASRERSATPTPPRATGARRRERRFEDEILPPPAGEGGRRPFSTTPDSRRPEPRRRGCGRFEKPDGVVTVGNACGITDGAGALVVTTAERAKALGLAPSRD